MLTFSRRRAPSAVAALAFAAPAQAEEVDPSTVQEEVAPSEVTPSEVLPPEQQPAEAPEAEESQESQDSVEPESDGAAPAFAARVAAPESDESLPAETEAVPAGPQECVPVSNSWYTQDKQPKITAAGLEFDGPSAASVNWYQRVSAGNAQGLTDMTYTIAPGSSGFVAQLKVEVNPKSTLGGSTVLSYATLSTIGNSDSGVIDAQDGKWYTSKIAYAQPGGMGNPLSWDDLVALMPDNVLLSAPSLHLQTNSTADSHSIVTRVSSSCGSTDFTVPAPVVKECTPSGAKSIAVTDPVQLLYEVRKGGSASLTTKGLELDWKAYEGNLSLAKAAWYYPLTGDPYPAFPLYELASTSVDYTRTSGASIGENYTIAVDGEVVGNIVREPGISNYWTTFSIPGMSPDPSAGYRKAIGTIQDFVNAYWADDMSHSVYVVAIGGSGGSGSEGAGVLKKQVAGCYTITYGVPVVTPPTTPPTPPTTPGTTTGGTTTGGTTTGGTTTTTTPAATATPAPTSTPAPSPSATPAPQSTAGEELPTEAFESDPASGGGLPWWLWLVALALLLVLALLWFLFFRKRNA